MSSYMPLNMVTQYGHTIRLNNVVTHEYIGRGCGHTMAAVEQLHTLCARTCAGLGRPYVPCVDIACQQSWASKHVYVCIGGCRRNPPTWLTLILRWQRSWGIQSCMVNPDSGSQPVPSTVQYSAVQNSAMSASTAAAWLQACACMLLEHSAMRSLRRSRCMCVHACTYVLVRRTCDHGQPAASPGHRGAALPQHSPPKNSVGLRAWPHAPARKRPGAAHKSKPIKRAPRTFV